MIDLLIDRQSYDLRFPVLTFDARLHTHLTFVVLPFVAARKCRAVEETLSYCL